MCFVCLSVCVVCWFSCLVLFVLFCFRCARRVLCILLWFRLVLFVISLLVCVVNGSGGVARADCCYVLVVVGLAYCLVLGGRVCLCLVFV